MRVRWGWEGCDCRGLGDYFCQDHLEGARFGKRPRQLRLASRWYCLRLLLETAIQRGEPRIGSLRWNAIASAFWCVVASRKSWQRGEALRGGIMTSPKAKKLPAELLRVNAQAPESDALRYAAHFLVRGCVIGIPTDTFYGLAADPFNLSAVDELYRVKGRPETRALPILVNSLDQALVLMRQGLLEGTTMEHPPRNFTKLAEAFWPGGLTLVVDASNRVPLKVTANTGKVALRWPKSLVVEQLIEEFGGPITGTSANISGFPACANTEQLMVQLGLRLPLVLDAGETGMGLPSTIVGLQGEQWEVLREGAIPVSEIRAALE